MDITVAVARVYGTNDQYGQEPRTTLPGTPVRLEGYPRAGVIAQVHFGAVPDTIVEAERGRRAIGRVMLGGLIGEDDMGDTANERFEYGLRKTADEPLFLDHNWYVTLVLSEARRIADDDFTDAPFAFSRHIFAEEDAARAWAKQPLDVLAAVIAGWDPGLLKDIVADDRIYFYADGKRPGGVPHISMSAAGQLTRGDESTRQFAESVAGLGRADLATAAREGWLAGTAHWRVQSLLEADRWKQFLWSFVGLEVLTNKLFERFRSEIVDRLRLEGLTTADDVRGLSAALPLEELMWSRDRTPLVAKFTLVALVLFPDSASDDVHSFRELKRARDRLAHGSLQEERELPVSRAVDLLGKVLNTAIERLVIGRSSAA